MSNESTFRQARIEFDEDSQQLIIRAEYSQQMLQPHKEGKLLFKERFITDGLPYVDADGKAMILPGDGTFDLRQVVLSPEAYAMELVKDEITERANAEKVAKGKKPVLTASARRRNRAKKAVENFVAKQFLNRDLDNQSIEELKLTAREELTNQSDEKAITRKAAAIERSLKSGKMSASMLKTFRANMQVLLSAAAIENGDKDKLAAAIATLTEKVAPKVAPSIAPTVETENTDTTQTGENIAGADEV